MVMKFILTHPKVYKIGKQFKFHSVVGHVWVVKKFGESMETHSGQALAI